MNELALVFDSKLLKILSDPVRVDILKILAIGGKMNISSITEQLPNDRSVISRHLSAMAEAGLVDAKKVGRHKIYELDSYFILEQLDSITETIRRFFYKFCPDSLEDKR